MAVSVGSCAAPLLDWALAGTASAGSLNYAAGSIVTTWLLYLLIKLEGR